MPWVLDASSMLALVRFEPGAAAVQAALVSPDGPCYAHPINLCEVYYVRARQDGEDGAAEVLRQLLEGAGVVPYIESDLEFAWEAGRLRALATSQRLALSLADCFCIATARALGCPLLTCDRREFEPIAAMSLCDVTFIR